MRVRVSVVGTAALVACLGVTGVADARNLRNTLGAPVEGRGGILEAALKPLGSVISAQIANTAKASPNRRSTPNMAITTPINKSALPSS